MNKHTRESDALGLFGSWKNSESSSQLAHERDIMKCPENDFLHQQGPYLMTSSVL